jgi:1,5-anhydro-D-fructose reductase (1,5-anhydro-D-mannitol-forming)
MRVGIVGLGQHAELMARAIGESASAELVAVASTSADRAADFAGRFAVRAERSYRDLVARDDLDLVLVTTTNNAHRDVTIAALEAGRNVLCEKPLALTVKDAEHMVQAAEASGRGLFVGFHLRSLAIVTEMRQRIERGEVGRADDLAFSRASQFTSDTVRDWRKDLAQSGGGVLCDVVPHLVDLVSHLTSEEIIAVHATARPERSSGRPDDRVVLVLSLEGGGVARVTATRGVVGAESELHVHGTDGSLCTSSLRWSDTHDLRSQRLGHAATATFAAGNSHRDYLDAIAAHLRGEASAVATGIDGLRGVRLLVASIASLSSGRTVAVE